MNETKKPNSVVRSVTALMCAIIFLKILPVVVYKLKNYTAIPDYVFYILFLLIPAILFFIFIQWGLRKFEIEVNRFVVIALALVAAFPSLKLMQRTEIVPVTRQFKEYEVRILALPEVAITNFGCYFFTRNTPLSNPVRVVSIHDIAGIDLQYSAENASRIIFHLTEECAKNLLAMPPVNFPGTFELVVNDDVLMTTEVLWPHDYDILRFPESVILAPDNALAFYTNFVHFLNEQKD